MAGQVTNCKQAGVMADVETNEDYSLDRAYEVKGTPGRGHVDVAEQTVLPSLAAGIGIGLVLYFGYRVVNG